MRIAQLSLIKYGKFTDTTLSFPQADCDFHLVIGPNEAGKSTLRSAVAELLFGMKLQTPLDFLHATADLRLGGVIAQGEQSLAFHRARGRTPLRTPSDEKLPEDALLPFLHGATKEFFEQMFGLDHDRLIEGGRSLLNASDKVGQVLFESAAGVGSLGPVREALEARALALWAPRRSGCEVAVAETAFLDAAGELKAAQVRTRDWVDSQEALASVNQAIDAARAEHQRLETQRSRLERVRRLAPFFKELAAKEEALAALGPGVELPASAHTDLLTAQGDIAAASRLLDDRRAELIAQTQARQSLRADERVLALADEIEEVARLSGACLNHPRDLPLRQAELNRHLAAALDAAEPLGWPRDEAALRAALPTSLALKTVTHLLRDQGALHQAVLGASEVLADKRHELAALTAQLRPQDTVAVPAALRAALADAQELRQGAVTLRAQERALATAERALEQALEGLGAWRMPPERLRMLTLPSLNRLAALLKEDSDRQSAAQAARLALDQAESELARCQLQEKHFAESHRVVTAAEVQAARVQRDGAWDQVKAGELSLSQGAPLVDAAIRLADQLVDTQLGATQAAATLQSLRQQLELAQAEVQRCQAARAEREHAWAQGQADGAALAAAAGLPGMPLADMASWLAARDVALAAQAQCEHQRGELDAWRATQALVLTALLSALRTVQPTVPAGEDLVTLIAAADAHVQSAERAATEQARLAERVRMAEQACQSAQLRLTTAQAAHRDWQAQWQAALAAARLGPAATTLAAAEGAVELAMSVVAHLAAAEDPRRRMAAMQADLEALASRARGLAAQLDLPSAQPDDPLDQARRLSVMLKATQEAAQAMRRGDDAVLQARSRLSDAEAALASAQARIDPLLSLAGVADIASALPLAERAQQRRLLLQQAEQAREALIRDGDGMPLAIAAAEVSAQDMAELPAWLEQTRQALAAVQETLNQRMQQQVTARQAFEAIQGQANAALAEARRQEALASLGDAAEQYLEAATASRLLKWAIDRYRDQKQGPMLKRAGDIFAGLTLADFTRLTVDTELQPPKLFAQRHNGSMVEVAGLSEGTRDQLFLALRVAAIELQLASKGALPFVADDLFINFDDQRAKAGLKALRDLSTRTQVVLLTHHDHLLPLVHEVFGTQVNVVALQRSR